MNLHHIRTLITAAGRTEEEASMKNGKRPTRRQLAELKQAGLNPENWLIERDTTDRLVVINRYSGKVRDVRRWA